MNVYSWLLIPALMAAFGCGTSTYYRIRFDRTPLAWTILAFTLCTFVLLLFYVIVINPYPQPRLVTYGFAGLALVLLLIGIAMMVFIPSAANRRLSLAEVRGLLPESILDLSPIEMRALLPARFQSHAAHEIQMFVMMQLTDMPPETIRDLTPETLRARLRRNIPYSILDSK
jgi:hypothetical protein